MGIIVLGGDDGGGTRSSNGSSSGHARLACKERCIRRLSGDLCRLAVRRLDDFARGKGAVSTIARGGHVALSCKGRGGVGDVTLDHGGRAGVERRCRRFVEQYGRLATEYARVKVFVVVFVASAALERKHEQVGVVGTKCENIL